MTDQKCNLCGLEFGSGEGHTCAMPTVESLQRELAAAKEGLQAISDISVSLIKQRETAMVELAAAKAALTHIVGRLQMDIDDGNRPDQWSMEDLVRVARVAIAGSKA